MKQRKGKKGRDADSLLTETDKLSKNYLIDNKNIYESALI